jgi:autotransporter passenger strand-loop-strand repeat protein
MPDTTINPGETSIGAVLNAGDRQYVYGTAHDTTINNGATQYVSGTATGAVIASGGTQVAQGGAVDNSVLHSGASLQITDVKAQITNLHYQAGALISVPEDPNDNYPPFVWFDQDTNNLYIHADPGKIVTVNMAAGEHYTNGYSDPFRIIYNGSSPGTLNVAGVGPTCFCAGVRIATPKGELLVEQLCVGDEVLTVRGRVRLIRWIGRQSVLFSAANRPVIVLAHALAEGMPSRDVRVTRCHSFLFGGVLIPIEQLVNGTTIIWDDKARSDELFHFELDRHDILLANGAPAESYRDIGNRNGFASGAVGGIRSGAMPTYAPLVYDGPIVERTRRRLAERANLGVGERKRLAG